MLKKSAELSLRVKNKGMWGGSWWAGGATSPLGAMWKPAARVSDINKLLDTTRWNVSPKSSVWRRVALAARLE